MVEKKATVRNGQGIHCRPSAEIVKALKDYQGKLWVSSESSEGDPRSIMSVIALGLAEGHRVSIRVEGPDEEATAEQLVELFERVYDFPPRKEGEEPAVPSELSS